MHYLQEAYSPRPRTSSNKHRAPAIAFIALLHVTVIYAFATSIGTFTIMPPPKDLIVSHIPDKVTPLPPPLPPPVDTFVPPPKIPVVPVLEIAPPSTAATAAITIPRVVETPSTPQVAVLPPPPQLVPARAIAQTHTTPDYPAISRRLQEQGTVRLLLTVGEDGMVIDAEIAQTSGHARLDAAAAEWVKGHWRYTPAMRGSMPIKAKMQAVLTFRLQ